MTTALIVGGGVAGTVTAIALRTVGVSSVICEAYPSGGEDTGAFLTVMHNGMAARQQHKPQSAWARYSAPPGRSAQRAATPHVVRSLYRRVPT